MSRLFPFLAWLPELRNWSVLRGDLIAGTTVAMVLIPQAMAYAELAGLAPVYGLNAACLPPVVAAFFGSSRQLSTGPVALAALISVATVAPLAAPGSEDFVAYSITLALMVGLIRLGVGTDSGLEVEVSTHGEEIAQGRRFEPGDAGLFTAQQRRDRPPHQRKRRRLVGKALGEIHRTLFRRQPGH